MIEGAIGLGLVVNLVFTEVFGLASGGLVVPGYLALFLGQPLRAAATLAVALAAWAIVKFGLSRLVILYGRRRFAAAVLCAFCLELLLEAATSSLPPGAPELRAIGFVVPGILASEMLSEGPLRAAASALAGAAIVRLGLFLIWGWPL